jgi:hypothetical protein
MAYTTINKPSDYFNTILTAGGSQSITSVGFQPDLVWNKRRDDTSDHHINDAVRGATKILFPNQNIAEQTNANFISSFDSDGFTTGSGYWNSGASIVAWNWLANGTGVSNTDGSITSTVSANTTSGFSIGTYTANGTTGATIGHGLSQKPNFILVKNRTSGSTNNWAVYHSSTGASNVGTLDNPQTFFSNTTYWNGSEPTSSVFTIGSSGIVNTSGNDYLFYCFAEKTGYSKFGSYTGNGSSDGTFVYTGFKPAFILVKQTNSTASWTILDNKRDSFNVTEKRLFPDSNDADTVGANGNTDFLSNGVKMRIGNANINASGSTYIYMAFAEVPLVGSNDVTAKAR